MGGGALIVKGRTPAGQQEFEGYYLKGLSDNFRNQADTELVVEDKYKLPCHSAILRLNSRVFDALLMKEAFDRESSDPGGLSASCTLLVHVWQP